MENFSPFEGENNIIQTSITTGPSITDLRKKPHGITFHTHLGSASIMPSDYREEDINGNPAVRVTGIGILSSHQDIIGQAKATFLSIQGIDTESTQGLFAITPDGK